MSTFRRSEALLRRARAVDAWATTRDAILEVDSANVGYPVYAERADGGYLWDVDGNRYLDLILGYGPVVLGHRHPVVNDAVVRSLDHGVCLSPMWTELQVELAELVCRVIPSAESAFFLRTGSDATSAAVRMARMFTGREIVVRWGYNGWHDWSTPRPAGVPAATRALTVEFNYNDPASLAAVLADHAGDVACVIMMAYGLNEPEDGFLQAVSDLAHEAGALFVLDEMRSGFRIDLAGAQGHYGVTPDLSTFSKAMANGYPISAVTGRADVLETMARSHMSSTYFANPAEMAAAIATIGELERIDGPARLWALGQRFVEGLEGAVEDRGFPAQVVGLPVSPFLEVDQGAPDGLRARLYSGVARRGVLLHPNHQWFFCTAHTEADIDMALEAIDDTIKEVRP